MLTLQQQAALEVEGASVALTAGAGCGKTTVLTERFLAALDDAGGRPLRSLVALTFTDKAARELRVRIRDRCREQLAAGQDPDRWRTILRGLDAAPIGTFHEFCARLLRQNAFEVGVDPEFGIFDPAIADSLRAESVSSEIRNRLVSRDRDFVMLAAVSGLGTIREALSALTSARQSFDLDTWASLEPEAMVARWHQVISDRVWPLLLRQATPVVAFCRTALESLESAHPKIRERRALLLEALQRLEPGSPRPTTALIEDLIKLARVQDLPRKNSWPSEQVYETVKTSVGKLRDQLNAWSEWDLSALSLPKALPSAEQSAQFARLTLGVRQEYARGKQARLGLDFDDIIRLTRDWLRGRDTQSSETGTISHPDPIEFILIDEFQDTDEIQSEILERLAGDQFLCGRLFIVGDIKQSIYRFRGAEPTIFREWRQRFPASGRLTLLDNFRSVPSIIGFVNRLFSERFAMLETGNDALELVARREQDICAPAIEFLWPGGDDPRFQKASKLSAHDRRAIEAAGIAQRLRDRLDEGWPIFDRGRKQIRNAHAGDIAFLFRSMTSVSVYESALADMGFDYHTTGGSAFYAQQEIHDVANLLAVLEDPLDEIALAGALRGPFFAVSDNGLYWLATGLAESGGLAGAMANHAKVPNLSADDRMRTARAAELLGHWREKKDQIPLADLIALILDESGYESALVCEFLGHRKLANVRKLVDRAREFDRQGGFTVAEFVDQLRANLDRPPREEQAFTTDEAGVSVRLMTIHQAKGLEFPIVVLPDLNRKQDPRYPLAVCHPLLGLVVRPSQAGPSESSDETIATHPGWKAFVELEREAETEEAIRLFYVAATRARDALLMSSGHTADDKASSPALALLDSRFDRQTGEPRVDSDSDSSGLIQPVHVTFIDHATPQQSRRHHKSPRPKLEQIENQLWNISRRAPAVASPSSSRVYSPLVVDLDPTLVLSNRAARVDRLIRGVALYLGLLGEAAFREALIHAGARQTPAANLAIMGEAFAIVQSWAGLEPIAALRRLAPEAIRAMVAFSWNQAVDGGRTTVFHGNCDLVISAPGTGPAVVLFSNSQVPIGRERLRLQLAAHALAADGSRPVVIQQGWLVRYRSEGYVELERMTRFDESSLESALKEWRAS
jgi:ATP-dependent helicase/nuclease subunit A